MLKMEIKKGNDYLEEGADYHTYGISVDGHDNQIEVYGDKQLRDDIVKFLQIRERIVKERTMVVIEKCVHQINRPHPGISMGMNEDGRGDCRICQPHPDNKNCSHFHPVKISYDG